MHRPRTALRALAAQSLVSILLGAQAQTPLAPLPLTTTTTVTSTSTAFSRTTVLTSSGVPVSTLTSTTPSNPPASSPADMAWRGAAFQSAVLNSTNAYRAQHQAAPVVWNTALAQFAQAHAQQCLWAHSNGPYGENLAENFAAPGLAVDGWAGEERSYDYATPRFSHATAHYTQLVWKGTTGVGCGAVRCDGSARGDADAWYLVCEYSPRGNVGGAFAENVGKAGEGADGAPGLGAAARGGGATPSGGLVGVAAGLASLLLALGVV